MDSIKKKMEKLASETAEAESRIKKYDEIKAAVETMSQEKKKMGLNFISIFQWFIHNFV